MSYQTCQRQEGYLTYSERFEEKFGQEYKVENSMIVPKTAKRLNFSSLLDLLKSKDASLLEANQWMFDGNSRFLDGKENLNGH